jgi:hypothetical protein
MPRKKSATLTAPVTNNSEEDRGSAAAFLHSFIDTAEKDVQRSIDEARAAVASSHSDLLRSATERLLESLEGFTLLKRAREAVVLLSTPVVTLPPAIPRVPHLAKTSQAEVAVAVQEPVVPAAAPATAVTPEATAAPVSAPPAPAHEITTGASPIAQENVTILDLLKQFQNNPKVASETHRGELLTALRKAQERSLISPLGFQQLWDQAKVVQL